MTVEQAQLGPERLHELFGLSGRAAIVTGASSGLGQRFAEILHAAGADVVVAARRGDRLEAVFGARPRFHSVVCDVTVAADRERVVAEAERVLGRVDILVNNAGIGTGGAAGADKTDRFRHVLEVDVVAPYALSELVAPGMRSRGSGSIINIASVFGLVAAAPVDDPAYCAAKGAVVNLTRQLGARWARRGIRVNAIAPGFFLTEISQATLQTSQSQDFIVQQCPIGRLGTPDELDAALLFLAGGGSTYVTGQIIVVDGGWTAR